MRPHVHPVSPDKYTHGQTGGQAGGQAGGQVDRRTRWDGIMPGRSLIYPDIS